MRQKLISIGAKIIHENGIITMTVKTHKNEKFPEEYEVEIKNSFKNGVNFLRALRLSQKAFQETFRKKWSHPLAHEIIFADIPGIPTYMEVDCTNENNLNKLVKLLQLDESKKRFGAYGNQYEEYYGINKNVLNDSTPSLTFKNIMSEIHPKKNIELLEKMYERYKMEGMINMSRQEVTVMKRIIKKQKILKRTSKKKSHKKSSRKSSSKRKKH